MLSVENDGNDVMLVAGKVSRHLQDLVIYFADTLKALRWLNSP
ncbi:hypothetical protein [Superficieibacter electus]|nr:hypothetical protein [Superficieibacter electus]